MFIKGLYGSRAILVIVSALSLLVPALTPIASSYAATTHKTKTVRVERELPVSPEKDAAIVVDGATGKVLYERNADAIRYPASLTKMMTLYLLFEALEKGTISLDTPMYASSHAVAQSPTKLYVPLGGTIDVDTAIRAITVLSANDVAVVIAEALGGGSEATFGDMMTARAHQLGMTNTNFHNASGLPDLQQLTTARDMALLARHLAYDFPQYFHYFSAPSVTFRGRTYFNHDHLLNEFDGTDGIKTGYTQLSGYNLVTSVVRDNKHVIGVVMGGPTAGVRDREMIELLSATFAVANENPTYLADANVPWYGGHGPGADLFRANPGEDNYLVTYLDENKGHVPILARLRNAPTTQGNAPIVVAGGAQNVTGASPLLKPVGPAAGPQVDQGDETQNASIVPLPKAETVKKWVVQVGVFADEALAQARLATMARRSVDLLGQAGKMVAILPGRHGHVMYRARFGLFAENEARGICAQMKRRKQSCIAVPEVPGANRG